MNKIETKFAPDTGFSLAPRPGPDQALHHNDLESLKRQLFEETVENSFEGGLLARLAADEAAALAWATPYPTLVFPVLFQEKLRAVEAHADRQAEVHRITRELLAL